MSFSIPTTWEDLTKDKIPSLTFTPLAWAKLLYLRDLENSEVSVFGLSSEENLFRVIDVHLFDQKVGHATFETKGDNALALYLSRMIEEYDADPCRCLRIWIHSHPFAGTPSPSQHDEDEFQEALGDADWAIMAIVSNADSSNGVPYYCRLQINQPIPIRIHLPIHIDYSSPEEIGFNTKPWKEEYDTYVTPMTSLPAAGYTLFPGGYARSNVIISAEDVEPDESILNNAVDKALLFCRDQATDEELKRILLYLVSPPGSLTLDFHLNKKFPFLTLSEKRNLLRLLYDEKSYAQILSSLSLDGGKPTLHERVKSILQKLKKHSGKGK